MKYRARIAHPRRTLRYWIGSIFLRFFGWSTEGVLPDEKKFVMIAAPHTSNWDMPFMLAVSYVFGLRISFMMKHTMFVGPFGPFFRWLGGIPVNRSARHNMVDQCVQTFNEADELTLAIPPEGTRGLVRYWKTGFYYIAHGANVPILLGFLDFKRKVGGVGPLVMPTGDLEADMDRIRGFYAGVTGKHASLMSDVDVAPHHSDKTGAA